MVAVRAGSTKFTIHIATARIFKPLIKGVLGWGGALDTAKCKLIETQFRSEHAVCFA